jgi:serine protease
MNLKIAGAIVICAFIPFLILAQPANKFKLPAGILTSDYEAGAVWVKIKPQYKDIFQGAQSARAQLLINASNVKPILNQASRNNSVARVGPRKLRVDISLYYKISFDKIRSVADYINELNATGYFEVVEPVYLDQSLFNPNDPLRSQQYYLNLIKAYEAWDVTQGSPSIVIGIVDTGGDMDHPDLQNNIYIDPADPTDGIDNDADGYIDNNRGWDFSGADASLIGTPGFIGDNDPSIPKGNRFRHGTMVAGCASATTNDGIGISGVGFNTKLLFTKHYADNQPDNST